MGSNPILSANALYGKLNISENATMEKYSSGDEAPLLRA